MRGSVALRLVIIFIVFLGVFLFLLRWFYLENLGIGQVFIVDLWDSFSNHGLRATVKVADISPRVYFVAYVQAIVPRLTGAGVVFAWALLARAALLFCFWVIWVELFFYSPSLPRCWAYSEFALAVISARSKDNRTHDRILLTKAYDGRTLLKDLNLVIISYCDYFLLLRRFGTRCRIWLLIFDQFYFFTVGRHQWKSW